MKVVSISRKPSRRSIRRPGEPVLDLLDIRAETLSVLQSTGTSGALQQHLLQELMSYASELLDTRKNLVTKAVSQAQYEVEQRPRLRLVRGSEK